MSYASRLAVHNANYDKVLYYLDKMLSESDKYCRCNRCRMDVIALALNTLPPHYFVDPTHAHGLDLGSPWVLIEMAVREAVERVLSHPNHSKDKEDYKDGVIFDMPLPTE